MHRWPIFLRLHLNRQALSISVSIAFYSTPPLHILIGLRTPVDNLTALHQCQCVEIKTGLTLAISSRATFQTEFRPNPRIHIAELALKDAGDIWTK